MSESKKNVDRTIADQNEKFDEKLTITSEHTYSEYTFKR